MKDIGIFIPSARMPENEPVGFVMYCLNFNHSRFQTFIIRLMVDEQHQGKGYGRGDHEAGFG
jgi:GNAT superfamily N-acetyltransferase